MKNVIIILVFCFVICIICAICTAFYGHGDVSIQFKRDKSGSSVCTGRGDSIGSAMADGFKKLYDGISVNSRLDTIQSRYNTMVLNLNENRRRMYSQDVKTCEKYILLTKELLTRKQAEESQKRLRQEDSSRLAQEKRAEQKRQRQQRETEKARARREKMKTMSAQRRFVAEQRSIMTDSLRYDVMHRDGFRCRICGVTAQDGYKLHVDHIIPVSKGGRTEMSNLRTLCERCNMGKRDKIETPPDEISNWITPEEFRELSSISHYEKDDDMPPLIESPAAPDNSTRSSAPTVIEARKMLSARGLGYVDKTEKGGCLYFFSEDAAEELKKSGYSVCYAQNGSKATKYRPAWYIK